MLPSIPAEIRERCPKVQSEFSCKVKDRRGELHDNILPDTYRLSPDLLKEYLDCARVQPPPIQVFKKDLDRLRNHDNTAVMWFEYVELEHGCEYQRKRCQAEFTFPSSHAFRRSVKTNYNNQMVCQEVCSLYYTCFEDGRSYCCPPRAEDLCYNAHDHCPDIVIVAESPGDDEIMAYAVSANAKHKSVFILDQPLSVFLARTTH